MYPDTKYDLLLTYCAISFLTICCLFTLFLIVLMLLFRLFIDVVDPINQLYDS